MAIPELPNLLRLARPPRAGAVLVLTGFLLALPAAAWLPKEREVAEPWALAPLAGSPVQPVPSDRWGGKLQPITILDDTSWWDGLQDATCHTPYYYDVDVEGGRLFAAGGRIFRAFDLSNPGAPSEISWSCGQNELPRWFSLDARFFLKWIDAPAGVNNIVAMGGLQQGFIVYGQFGQFWGPKYQDVSLGSIKSVYAAPLAGRNYGFAVSEGDGIVVYDLTTASGLGGVCLRETGSDPCGVFKRLYDSISIPGFPDFPDQVHGAGNLLVVSSAGQIKVVDVASPLAPVVRITQTLSNLLGFELWQAGGQTYFAWIADGGSSSTVRIYNLTCATTGSCTSLPAPLSTLTLPTPTSELSASLRNGTTPVLFAAWEGFISQCASHEYLYDVSNPAAPVDLSPNVPNKPYWRWYPGKASCSDPGFNGVIPARAKAWGDYLYRGSLALLDVHRMLAGPPPLGITSFQATCGTSCFEGNAITFNQSFTGSPTLYEYDWEGDGTYEQSSGTPDTSNTYPHGVIPRSVAAKIRVSDGTQQATATAPSFTLQCNPGRTVPPEPSGLAANPVAPTLVNLTWADVANEYQYRAERLLENGTYQLLQTLPENSTFYQATGLSSGLGYWFDVRASSCAGTSPGATPVFAVTPAASDVFSNTFEPGESPWDHFSPP